MTGGPWQYECPTRCGYTWISSEEDSATPHHSNLFDNGECVGVDRPGRNPVGLSRSLESMLDLPARRKPEDYILAGPVSSLADLRDRLRALRSVRKAVHRRGSPEFHRMEGELNIIDSLLRLLDEGIPQ